MVIVIGAWSHLADVEVEPQETAGPRVWLEERGRGCWAVSVEDAARCGGRGGGSRLAGREGSRV